MSSSARRRALSWAAVVLLSCDTTEQEPSEPEPEPATESAPAEAPRRGLAPLPGWTLTDLQARWRGAILVVETKISVEQQQPHKYNVVARATCRGQGRAFTDHVTAGLAAGGSLGYGKPPEAGRKLDLVAEINGMHGDPCQIEMRAVAVGSGWFYRLGSPYCLRGGTLSDGACEGLVQRPSQTEPAVAVDDLVIRPNGYFHYVATPGQQLESTHRLGLRARCVDGEYARSWIRWSLMGWQHVEPGESRNVDARLFDKVARDDCELSVELAHYDVSERIASDSRVVFTACLQDGRVTEGRCPADMFGAGGSAPATTAVELLGVELSTRADSRGFRVTTTAALVAHMPLSRADRIELDLDCGLEPELRGKFELESDWLELHDVGARERFDYSGRMSFARRPETCAASLELVREAAKKAERWSLGRWCGAPDGPLSPCSTK